MEAIAKMLNVFGCWGVVALFAWAVVFQYKEAQRSHRRELEMAASILPLISELKGFVYAMRAERRP